MHFKPSFKLSNLKRLGFVVVLYAATGARVTSINHPFLHTQHAKQERMINIRVTEFSSLFQAKSSNEGADITRTELWTGEVKASD
jgi:hypothetical protein